MDTTTNPVGEATARFIATSAGRHYAPEVIDAAKKCLVDYMGVALGAHADPTAEAVRRAASAWGTAGGAHMLLGPTASAGVAALVNGTMAHCMDYDDTHLSGAGHISAPTWSTALALAEDRGLSERDALHAFITGFEVSARLGGGGFGRRLQMIGFHPSSVLGRFGAAAVACALLGLDAERTAHALGVAATTAAGLNASFGTMSKPFHLGKAAMDGILAAELAAEGFEAATHLLDADNGLCGAFVQDRSVRIDATEFSEGFALLQNTFKPYACCRATHAHVDAARSLHAALKGRAVERVVLSISPTANKVASIANPRTPLEGKFSTAYCVALGLLGHRVLEGDFIQERVDDPAVRDLLARVQLNVDPERDLSTGVMEVILADGERLQAETQKALGHPDNPMSWGDMETKFLGLVEPVLGNAARPLLEALRTFEEPGRLAQVAGLVAPRNGG